MSHGRTTDITLVFALDALGQLARPAAAVSDAREWTANIGIVTDGSPEAVTAFVEERPFQADFTSGEGSIAGSLALARQRFSTDRHVFVGSADEERSLARSLGWEYLDIAEAAAKAGWQVTES